MEKNLFLNYLMVIYMPSLEKIGKNYLQVDKNGKS